MGLVRPNRCSVCGRNVRGMVDARKEGGRWFCSPSCLFQGSSGKWKRPERSGPVRAVRRVVKWTLIAVGLLIAVGVVAAIVGVGKTTKTPRPPAGAKTFARYVAPVHVIPVGVFAPIGSGWQMKVLSVKWNASGAHLGFGPGTPKGAEDVVVKIRVKYLAGGSGNSQSVTNQVNAVGSHHAVYRNEGVCGGNDQFGDGGLPVFSQQTTDGNVCFQIAKNDATTLKLYVYPVGSPIYPSSGTRRVWFALR